MKAYTGSGGVAPLILHLGARWRDLLLGEIIRVSVEGGRAAVETREVLLPGGIRALDRAVRRLITTLIVLPRLLKAEKKYFKIDCSLI